MAMGSRTSLPRLAKAPSFSSIKSHANIDGKRSCGANDSLEQGKLQSFVVAVHSATTIEYCSAAKRFRNSAFVRQSCLEVGKRFALMFNDSCQVIKTFKALELLRMAQPRGFQRTTQHCQRFVICLERHRKRVSVFAAVCKRKTRRVGESARCTVDNLSNECQRL